jgi:hypothetical protein
MRYLGDGEAHGNGFVSFACGADSIVLPRKNVLRTRQWTTASAYPKADETEAKNLIRSTTE